MGWINLRPEDQIAWASANGYGDDLASAGYAYDAQTQGATGSYVGLGAPTPAQYGEQRPSVAEQAADTQRAKESVAPAGVSESDYGAMYGAQGTSRGSGTYEGYVPPPTSGGYTPPAPAGPAQQIAGIDSPQMSVQPPPPAGGVVASPPVIGGVAPPYSGGGGGYDRQASGYATGGGSGGSGAATGSMPAPGGGQSQWSQILHQSGALQDPMNTPIPFDQYPGSNGMFDPYMQARYGGQPGQATGQSMSGNMGPNANAAPSSTPATGVSPGGPAMTSVPPDPMRPSVNMNSPAVSNTPPAATGMAPAPVPGAFGSSALPPGPGMGSPEEALVMAGHMNAALRKRYGGF
jgi:hypothetical protein